MNCGIITSQVKTIIKLIKKLLRRSRSSKTSTHSQHIVKRSQHSVSKTDISVNALNVLNRIHSHGFEAYLVGGSVRDLLLHQVPKDFDIATNATPNQVKNLFRNSRIIGRRFKLVHILFHREIIEVATFRGYEPVHTHHIINERGMLVRDNVYGTLEEDAWRRDFSINSLYYNIEDSSIIDFTGGVSDINSRLIRVIGDPKTRYQEDPVRMLRALRFSAKLHFDLEAQTCAPLEELSGLLRHISGSRLFDEVTKLYQCGSAKTAHHLLVKYGLFGHLFEQTNALLASDYPIGSLIDIALESTDARIHDNKPVTPAFLFAILLWFPLLSCAATFRQEGMHPLPALEKAMSEIISIQNKTVTIPKRFTQVIREIWLMQYRFDKRSGNRAFHLLQHPRFRAAYDFLALRALAGNESMELADWWTRFQEVDEAGQKQMVDALTIVPKHSKRKRKPKPRPES